MILSDLIAAFRTESYDQVLPYLWSDAEVAGYLADAEAEACVRARLLYDETTVGVSEILINDDAWVPLHPSILTVDRARLASDTAPLTHCPPDDLDVGWPGWDTQTGAPALYYVLGGKLRLVPQPTTDEDTLYLSVYRLPLVPLTAEDLGAEPEIPEPHHPRLVDWALSRAYSKHDPDAFDAARSELHRQRFEANFGPRPSGSAIRQQAERRRHVVRPIAF